MPDQFFGTEPAKGQNVIALDRPAAYWLDRARKSRGEAQLKNAALFLRKALEKENDPRTCLELARVYYQMHCYDVAERLLLRVLMRLPDSGEGYYLLALCALSRGEEGMCQDALDKSLRVCPDGSQAEKAQDMLNYYSWRENTPPPKRGARAYTLRLRAESEEDGSQALKLAEKAFRLDHSAESALCCANLIMGRDPEKAGEYLRVARIRGVPEDEKMRYELLCALTCAARRDREEAGVHLSRAAEACYNTAEAELLVRTALGCGVPWEAEAFLQRELARMPFATGYLNLLRVTQCVQGKAREALKTRAAILAVDPNDPCLIGEGSFTAPYPHFTRALVRETLYEMTAPEGRLRRGIMNRMTHMVCMSLRETAVPAEVFAIVPPLLRRLPRCAWRHLEEDGAPEWRLAFSAAVLLTQKKRDEALALLRTTSRRRRVRRCLKRLGVPLGAGLRLMK